ncbi:MAG: hypothetical protein JXB47_12220 [Anaerolineae bacterium]|nr:hypothetical protein [Anaerolineae bacterium]
MLTGSVYIGAVGAEMQPVAAVASVIGMRRRPGDGGPVILTPTKGYEGRQKLIEMFLASDHDFILLLDLDMQHPPDLLERLRAHGLPMVSGLYVKRAYAPVQHIWFEDDPGFNWPMQPVTAAPPPGALVRLGATGWGAVLIHRCVFEGVAPLLKGEPFVIEDDMDVWPYDLAAVLCGAESLRPLRADKSGVVGSDIRFGFFVRQAGFPIWGDPDARSGHYINYPLTPDDFTASAAMCEHVAAQIEAMRAAWRERVDGLAGQIQEM